VPALSGGDIVVVAATAEGISGANAEAVRSLVERGYGGVYVALTEDYLSVSAELASVGVDVRGIKFVDVVSRMYGIAPVSAPEVLYVDGPLSVDAIIGGIASSLRSVSGSKKFVLVDSLTALALYHSTEATLAFSDALKGLLLKEDAAGVVLLPLKGDHDDDLVRGLRSAGNDVVSASGATVS
jgi:KaiC/GvpD/RAD55 family RecA-like ATPase